MSLMRGFFKKKEKKKRKKRGIFLTFQKMGTSQISEIVNLIFNEFLILVKMCAAGKKYFLEN